MARTTLGLLAAGLLAIGGVGLVSGCDRSSRSIDATLPDTVTYAAHVAPIIRAQCVVCHRPGWPGPFSLITYQEAASRAAMLAAVTASRQMPPWPADPTYRHFADERVLTDREIALIGRWAKTGAVAGDTAGMPPLPALPQGSQLGKPDLVLTMPKAYQIPGDRSDRFVTFKIPFELPQDTFVRAIEFVPGNRRLVHHMNAHLINYAPGAKRDVFRGQDVYLEDAMHSMTGLPQLDLLNDDGSFAPIQLSVSNYLPGWVAKAYPKGIGGFRFNREGALVVNQIHYGPSAVADSDQSYFNIFFSATPPTRPLYDIVLGTTGVSPVVPDLIIPPNVVKTVRTQARIPADISIVNVNPHMHLLGKSFVAYAVTPAGDTLSLVRIPRWDFRWQYFYTPEHLLRIPAGTTIYAEGVYDNTTANPHNPFSPPREIREHEGSMKTTDEMFQLIISYLKYEPGDETIDLEGSFFDR